jgi:hypothetical protein
LAYNFNDNPVRPTAQAYAAETPAASSPSNASTTVDTRATTTAVTAPPVDAPATSDVPESAAWVRFRSCRWQQPKDEANPAEFCTHREVKPYAGTTGFDPDAWCPECQYYKLRRAPKKRAPNDDYSY